MSVLVAVSRRPRFARGGPAREGFEIIYVDLMRSLPSPSGVYDYRVARLALEG